MRIPKHVGVIPDGNRRWAKEHGMKKEGGYNFGLVPGLQLLKELRKYGVEEVTYYGFTVDNCKRPKEQVESFQAACVEAVKMIKEEDVSLVVVGNIQSDCFPNELLPYTKCNHSFLRKGQMKVNFLVNYSWKWDLETDASQNISRIDMLIRWGGMCRLSGFLPRQSVYADIFVIKDLWPDFCIEQVQQAMDWYQKQDVTLGG